MTVSKIFFFKFNNSVFYFLVFNSQTGNIISDLQQETLGQDSSKTKTKLDIPAANIHKSVISQNNGEDTMPKAVNEYFLMTDQLRFRIVISMKEW